MSAVVVVAVVVEAVVAVEAFYQTLYSPSCSCWVANWPDQSDSFHWSRSWSSSRHSTPSDHKSKTRAVDCKQRYIITISNSKKTSTITINITYSNSNNTCFYFPSNNSNRNCITTLKKPNYYKLLHLINVEKICYTSHNFITRYKIYIYFVLYDAGRETFFTWINKK